MFSNQCIALCCFIFLAMAILPPRLLVAADVVSSNWNVSETGTNVSLRGLSAVDDDVIWASGAEATVIRSIDGGETWQPCGPAGFDGLEFRCVCAFSANVACIASAGTPAVLLRTEDGGETWKETYRAESETAFFDAMQFWDADRGMAVSDPVDGRLLVVETNDGGNSWRKVTNGIPLARPGEAAFAASNSSLLLGADGQLWFGTGGAESDTSRLYTRSGWDQPWVAVPVPMPSSQAAGIFAICQGPAIGEGDATKPLICVGGDYRASETSEVTACISLDDGATWQRVAGQPESFRSDVMAIPEGSQIARALIAVGPAGTDLSHDGTNWTSLSDIGFHCLSAGKTKLFACGSDGRFAQLE
ncbi:WD40/YVTN/BNR-like repeat-containing protein [Rhodopirellula baltica]|uniref:WD40/YVTN/BNR-like repeat-containing protein n=1 Tax=Rhodopirellula baltica TaxID=265606 RepID=UPI00055A7AB0|nr:YCF48-related protein [Rhodopirellula baltica]